MCVCVVGAGPAGLTLARILQVHGIPTSVLERDSSPRVRPQGGSLDLHPDTGQHALEAAGLTQEFRALAREEGQEHKIFSPTGDLMVHHLPTQAGGRPEIDRSDLRDLLLESLSPATVHWGAHIVTVDERASGGFHLRTADGREYSCDLLVGADGGASIVRPLLTDAATAYLSSYTQMTIPDIDRTHPDLGRLVGQGSLWALGRDQNLTAQRQSSGLVRVSTMIRSTHPWRPADRDAVLERYADWSPTLTALLKAAEEPMVTRDIRVTPMNLRWPSHTALTLIGDAAHLMPPVGEGANQAMRDAADLAAELITTPSDISGAIHRYETTMRLRISPIEQQSAQMERLILSPTALEDMVAFFTPATQRQ